MPATLIPIRHFDWAPTTTTSTAAKKYWSEVTILWLSNLTLSLTHCPAQPHLPLTGPVPINVMSHHPQYGLRWGKSGDLTNQNVNCPTPGETSPVKYPILMRGFNVCSVYTLNREQSSCNYRVFSYNQKPKHRGSPSWPLPLQCPVSTCKGEVGTNIDRCSSLSVELVVPLYDAQLTCHAIAALVLVWLPLTLATV